MSCCSLASLAISCGFGHDDKQGKGPPKSFLTWPDLVATTDTVVEASAAQMLLSSVVSPYAYVDQSGSLGFFQIPKWGNFGASRRLDCERLLLSPKVTAEGDRLWTSASINYDQCLEPAWFDLYRTHQLSLRFFAMYRCEGESFDDLSGKTLGELPKQWQQRGRCLNGGAVESTWAYEIVRDYQSDFSLIDDPQAVRQLQIWRLALMAKDGGPCQGQWQEGDFSWQDCQFGLRQWTKSAWQNGKTLDHLGDNDFRAAYKGVHGLGTGYYIRGQLQGRLAQWRGHVQFAPDKLATRLIPERPMFAFKFGSTTVTGQAFLPE